MFRTAILAAATAASLGGGMLMACPTSAAPAAAGQAIQAGQGLVAQTQHYRSGPRAFYRPRCFWSDHRIWNGWRWVVRPVRVCR